MKPAARDQDAHVRARVPILPLAGDPQVERLALVGDRVPVGVAAHERDRSRRRAIRQIPDGGA